MLTQIFVKSLFFSTFLFKIAFTKYCSSHNSCKCVLFSGETIDLSSIGAIDFPRFYDIDGTTNNLYSYNPCYPIVIADKGVTLKKGNVPCLEAAACVRTPGGNNGSLPEEHAIGIQSTAVFGNTTQYDFHINYTVPKASQTLTVKLICDENATESLLFISKEESEENQHVVMNLTSRCACPGLCSPSDPTVDNQPGLSTGSKLLITFFTILLSYFIIGTIWKFCNGAQGPEMIPNSDFWNDLPKLVVEGIAFTCTCFGRKSSYGEV